MALLIFSKVCLWWDKTWIFHTITLMLTKLHAPFIVSAPTTTVSPLSRTSVLLPSMLSHSLMLPGHVNPPTSIPEGILPQASNTVNRSWSLQIAHSLEVFKGIFVSEQHLQMCTGSMCFTRETHKGFWHLVKNYNVYLWVTLEHATNRNGVSYINNKQSKLRLLFQFEAGRYMRQIK